MRFDEESNTDELIKVYNIARIRRSINSIYFLKQHEDFYPSDNL